jgi:hypothetical protein
MAATLAHPTVTLSAARPASRAWFSRLLLALGNFASLVAEVREEERKAHARYPHLIEW